VNPDLRRAAACTVAAAIVLAAGGCARPALPTPPPTVRAEGAPAYDFTTTGVRIRADTDPDSAVLGYGSPGDGFAPQNCQGEYNSGTDLRTGVTGWVWYAALTGDC
jgi:hypothetical protein